MAWRLAVAHVRRRRVGGRDHRRCAPVRGRSPERGRRGPGRPHPQFAGRAAVLSGFGGLLGRRRVDTPVAVARNYGGTVAVVLVSAALLAVGLAKQSYCVIVKPRLPLDRSVVFTGYEP